MQLQSSIRKGELKIQNSAASVIIICTYVLYGIEKTPLRYRSSLGNPKKFKKHLLVKSQLFQVTK